MHFLWWLLNLENAAPAALPVPATGASDGQDGDALRRKYLAWLRKKRKKPTKLDKNKNRYSGNVVEFPKSKTVRPQPVAKIKTDHIARQAAIETIASLVALPLSSAVNDAPLYELLDLLNELTEEDEGDAFMMVLA